MKVAFRHYFYNFLADVTAFVAAYAVAFGLALLAPQFFPLHQLDEPRQYVLFMLVAFAIQVAVFFWEGTYRSRESVLKIHASRRLLRGLMLSPAPIIMLSFLPAYSGLSKVVIVAASLINIILNPIFRSLAEIQRLPSFDAKVTPKKLLILGNGVAGECLLRRVKQDKNPRYNLLGFLEKNQDRVGSFIQTNSLEIRGEAKVLGTYQNLNSIVEETTPDEIWINDPTISAQEVGRIFTDCESKKIEVSLVPTIGDYPPQSLEVEMLDIVPIIRRKKPDARPVYEASKRLIDLFASGFMLTILSPLFLLIAILIKRDSAGPVFFKQNRVGLNGKHFKIYKFRSMYTHSNPYSVSPSVKGDSRITPIGRFLRRTSLDELPQLINVFRGEMSLVGPRPEMPFIVDQYNDLERFRLSVKPGITGPWQVSADRSIPIHQNLDYDFFYIQNRSVLLDLTLLWRTVFLAMRGI